MGKFIKTIISLLFLSLFILSCSKLLSCDDKISDIASYEVEYIYQGDNEYNKLNDKYFNLSFYEQTSVLELIKKMKLNENCKCGITNNNNNYKMIVGNDYIGARLFFYEDRGIFYDTYDVISRNKYEAVENVGFSLYTLNETLYEFKIHAYVIFKTTDSDKNKCFVKVPFYLIGQFNLKNNYLECEIDI